MNKCFNCGKELTDTEIFEGLDESYCCSNCNYEGYTKKGVAFLSGTIEEETK